MFKKWICAALCLLLFAAPALGEGALVLSGQAVVDGGRVWYAGDMNGQGQGVWVMNSDGSGTTRLVSDYMTLLCADGGNLMAISYSEGAVDYAVVVYNALGEKVVVYDGYVSAAIAADGRFYWGVGSCKTDGSDAHLYIDDRVHSYNYYPVAVDNGYYYYLDWAFNSDGTFYEGSSYPLTARLCRIDLSNDQVEPLTGYGTRYLGLDDQYIYYARSNYWLFNEAEGNAYEAEVEQGVYRADKNTLETERIIAFPDNEDALVSYQFMQDGIIYGEYTDFGTEELTCEIVRATTNGTLLPSLSLDNQDVTLHGVYDGRLYVSLCAIEYAGDDYIQHDLLYAFDLNNETFLLVSTPVSDQFNYAESEPAIGVYDGRIYMIVFDTDVYAVALKSCDINGADRVTLARGAAVG